MRQSLRKVSVPMKARLFLLARSLEVKKSEIPKKADLADAGKTTICDDPPRQDDAESE